MVREAGFKILLICLMRSLVEIELIPKLKCRTTIILNIIVTIQSLKQNIEYSRNRTVVVNSKAKSLKKKTERGSPQEPVLGPLMYNLVCVVAMENKEGIVRENSKAKAEQCFGG